jgi:glycine betaine/proline transport system permease protein
VGLKLLGLLVTWLVLWYFLRGRWGLETGVPATVQDWLQQLTETIGTGRLTNPLFVYVFAPITAALGWMYDTGVWLTTQLGWTGVTAIGAAIALVWSGWRMALLATVGFLCFGLLGLWEESMQTLVLVIISVVLSLLIGIPLGIWAGTSDRVNRIMMPILDTLQIMPSFAYLPFITLFFLIGPPAGIIATLIYAIPPTIRLTSVGIREVNAASVEAATSLGATARQRLVDVQLPIAKRTMVVGINQTVMAALSMVTIAAVIATPGLGQSVLSALEILNVGQAFNAGLAIVIMAIVLDRVITAGSKRSAAQTLTKKARISIWAVAVAIIALGALLPALVPSTATWKEQWIYSTTDAVNTFAEWIQQTLYPTTTAFTEWFTNAVINPLEALFTQSPFFVVMAVLAAIPLILGRTRAAIVVGICMIGCALVGLWPDSMETLTQVVLAAAATMLLGLVFGVWIGRSPWADRIIRPVLDAAQVMPPFVYLIPALALFGPTRFTAIVAAIIYAAPAVIKIVGEGIATVSSDSVGANRWQEISTVQVPMARPILLVALNQGIVFVMSMVVIGGLVGGGGLGYEVVKGFSQERFAGVGLAAGVAIVCLGIALDRISQSAGSSRRQVAQATH